MQMTYEQLLEELKNLSEEDFAKFQERLIFTLKLFQPQLKMRMQ